MPSQRCVPRESRRRLHSVRARGALSARRRCPRTPEAGLCEGAERIGDHIVHASKKRTTSIGRTSRSSAAGCRQTPRPRLDGVPGTGGVPALETSRSASSTSTFTKPQSRAYSAASSVSVRDSTRSVTKRSAAIDGWSIAPRLGVPPPSVDRLDVQPAWSARTREPSKTATSAPTPSERAMLRRSRRRRPSSVRSARRRRPSGAWQSRRQSGNDVGSDVDDVASLIEQIKASTGEHGRPNRPASTMRRNRCLSARRQTSPRSSSTWRRDLPQASKPARRGPGRPPRSRLPPPTAQQQRPPQCASQGGVERSERLEDSAVPGTN